MSTWEKVRPSLHAADYWIKTDCVKWSAVDYSSFLLNSNPSLSKQSTMKLYCADIDVLMVHFEHKKLICSRLKALKKMLGKDECLNQFWRDFSKDVKKLSLKRKLNQYVALTTVEENAVKSLCTESNNHASSSLLSNCSNSNVVEVSNDNDKEIEHDEVFVEGLNISVGTLIKRKALEIHEQFKDNMEQCPIDDRKVMSSGLSSILDLSDASINSQYRYFSSKQWLELCSRFQDLKINPLPVDSLVKTTLTIISQLYRRDASVNKSLKYVKSILDNDPNVQQSFCLAVLKHFLKLVKDYQSMLACSPLLDYTESDYTCIIWFKLFKKMFPPGNGIVRIKTGESIFDKSTVNKKELYPKQKYIKGFKIDIRFVVDVNGNEVDLAAAEIAKDDTKSKTISDEGKLTREGKDIVDNLVSLLSNIDLKSRRAYLFQITCNTCIVSTLDLACNGLYVASSQTNFVLPSKPDDFNDLTLPLGYLLSIKSSMESLGLEIKSTINNRRMSTVETLGIRQVPKKPTECINWIRSTYYSPPGKTPSGVPSFVFGGPPPSILNKLKEVYQTDRGKKYEVENDHNFDEFGWKLLSNGKYYNKYLKEAADHHPLMKRKDNI